MKIPKKIHFAGHTYDVKEHKNLDGDSNWGRTTMHEGKIRLEKDVMQSAKEETFLHELLHIAYRHTFSEIDNDKEEKIIKAFSRNIYGILKDNNLLK